MNASGQSGASNDYEFEWHGGSEYPDTTVQDDNREEESMTPRPTRLSGTLAAALIVGGIGCSPTAPSASPPVSNDFVTGGIVPVAGKPAEHTAVQIWGTGFQSGATVTFDGSATPATVDGGWIYTTAPPHSAGPIDIAVINPDAGRAALRRRLLTSKISWRAVTSLSAPATRSRQP
jgi:hypothetical protein